MIGRSSACEKLNRPGGIQIGVRRSERRGRRFPVFIPVLVQGFDAGCRLFGEAASTFNISRAGCCLRVQARPLMDSVIALRVVPRQGPIPDHPRFLYQVAWLRQEDESWVVGALALVDTDLASVAFGATVS